MHVGFWILIAALFLHNLVLAVAGAGNEPNWDSCCAILSASLGNLVVYPSSTLYTESLDSYFSDQEQEITPLCIVKPISSSDVSAAVQILSGLHAASNTSCKFAVRSGGYMTWAGSANIEEGVTIDLRELNRIDLNPERTLTSVGPGAVWEDVYLKLDAMNLTVAGGRTGTIGVGGFLTGGGISYLSPQHGFACDNVLSYELILANGTLINVNATSHPDLRIALRGGSNNFGIITRFSLATFPQGNIWGGNIYYNTSTATAQLAAFHNFTTAENYDEKATLILSFGYAAAQGAAAVNTLVYMDPVESPLPLQPFTSIQPQYLSTMSIRNVTAMAVEEAASSPPGFRGLQITTTFRGSLTTLSSAFSLYSATVPLISAIPGIQWSLSLQPLPPAITSKAASLGGNSLGLTRAEGPLALALLTASWRNTTDDELISGTARRLFDDIDAAAQSQGTYYPYKYLNYALKGQDPIGGYGPESKARLQALSRKYDPRGIFQNAVPGGFKLVQP